MASTADFRNGLVIEFNNDLYTIVQFQHVKPGKGPAFVRTKLKSLKNGRVIDNTFSSGTKVNLARVERRPYQYLYKDDMGYYFMHLETFEQVHVQESLIDNHEFLLEGASVEIVVHADIEEEGDGMSPVLKHLNFIQTLSSIIIVAIENIRLFNESLRQEAFKKELELAAKMQKMLIPENSKMPKNPKIVVNGFYFPHYEVGGDYYDCIKLSETKTGLCIADVSGKGISAAILMSNFQASLRALFTWDTELEVLINKLNSIVVVNAAGEKFITLFVARYDHETRVLEYINAAHNPPVLYNTVSGDIIHLRTSCVGLGMLDDIPVVHKTELLITDFSKIVCYTDGLSELKYENGKDIGTTEIIRHISNTEPVEVNIRQMIKDLGLPFDNPSTFDDVSIIAADLVK